MRLLLCIVLSLTLLSCCTPQAQPEPSADLTDAVQHMTEAWQRIHASPLDRSYRDMDLDVWNPMIRILKSNIETSRFYMGEDLDTLIRAALDRIIDDGSGISEQRWRFERSALRWNVASDLRIAA